MNSGLGLRHIVPHSEFHNLSLQLNLVLALLVVLAFVVSLLVGLQVDPRVVTVDTLHVLVVALVNARGCAPSLDSLRLLLDCGMPVHADGYMVARRSQVVSVLALRLLVH